MAENPCQQPRLCLSRGDIFYHHLAGRDCLGLAPAVVLTLTFAALLAVPKLAVVAISGAALNLAGAVVDFAIAVWLPSLQPGTWVEDLRDGIRVLPIGETERHLRAEWLPLQTETRG